MSALRTYIIAIVLALALSAVGIGYYYSGYRLSATPDKKVSVSSPGNDKKNGDGESAHDILISGIVVPHHDIVKSVRDALFTEIAPQVDPSTIVLLSPNHFDQGDALVQTTKQEWTTSRGSILPNTNLISGLVGENFASLEPQSFELEHGIVSLLEDVKKNFPTATIVPLILKRGVPEADLEDLTNDLYKKCLDCLLIASVDFSHNQPPLLADLHDEVSSRALRNLDVHSLLTDAEVDSPESLGLLALWAKHHGTKHFNLFEHTNTGFLLNDPENDTTTHIFGWYGVGEQVTPEPSLTFTIVGDTMFARKVADEFQEDLSKSLAVLGDRFFWGTDIALVNLEGVIHDKPITPNISPDNYRFRFSPHTVDVLDRYGVTAVSLANNHSNNGGARDLAYTRKTLDDHGIAWFGGPRGEDTKRIARFEQDGIGLSIIGVNALAPFQDISDQIVALSKSGDLVMVYPHWGVEYAPQHSKQQETMAHDWIDAGADIIVGAHPHVIQDVELYKGRPIIYSLGNFLFDQTFSQETQEGIALSGKFTDKGLELFATPLISRNYQPQLMEPKQGAKLLDRVFAPWHGREFATSVGSTYFFPY